MKVSKVGRRNLLIIAAVAIIISVSALLLYGKTSPKQNSTLMTRGIDYQIVNNHDGTYTWSSEPQWVNNGTSYVPYIFEDRYSDSYYQIQTGLIGARVYDNYVQFLKPDLSTVQIQSEQWLLQYSDNGQWKNATLSNLRWNITKSDQYIEITKIWDTSYASTTGVLEITYHFGENLEHIIRWRNTSTIWLEPRFIQSWEGINGVSLSKSVDPATGKDAVFIIRDASGNIAVIEDQTSAISLLGYSSVDISSKKASFIFSGFDLAKPIEIDPTTTTIQPSTKDTMLYGTANAGTNYGTATSFLVYDYAPSYASRSILDMDISSIPSGASISSATLSLYYFANTEGNPSGRTYNLYKLTQSAWTELGATWNTYDGTHSWGTAGGDYSAPSSGTAMPSSFGWVSWDATSIVQNFVNAQSSSAQFLLKDALESGTTAMAYFYSREYATDTSLRPKLSVTYTTCAPPATGDWNVSSSCTMTLNTTVKGNLILNGTNLTLSNNNLYIKP